MKWSILIGTEGYFIEFNIIDININLSKIGRNGKKLEITMKLTNSAFEKIEIF